MPSPSPPRRAQPSIPSEYIRPNFSASSQVLSILSQSADEQAQTLAQLRKLRESISTYLHAEAPEWDALTPAISRLHSALQTTQSASTLRESLSTLPSSQHYADRMTAVVTKASRLSAIVSVCAAAKAFAKLLETIEQVPAGKTPANFLQHAISLQKARQAANESPLSHVRALDDARLRLDRRHSLLLARLQRHLLTSVYSSAFPFETPPPEPPTNTFSISKTSSMQASPPPNSLLLSTTSVQPSCAPPTRTLPPAITPDLARAIDALSGPGSAGRVLLESASTRLVALVRDALMLESSAPTKTMHSLASSSFTAAATSSPSSLTSHLFREPSSSRQACSTAFERVKYLMTAVLRRLSALVDAFDAPLENVSKVVVDIVGVIEGVLATFLQALLAFPRASCIEPGKTTGISLLPTPLRPTETDQSGSKWELERGQPSLDTFVNLISAIPKLSPSIYNLEVVYSSLQTFTMNSKRLRESLLAKELNECALSELLEQAVNIFLSTVRQDVKRYMGDAFGNRAGTMLQPFSMRQRGNTTNSNPHIVPALPQTKVLIEVISSCLSLAAAVPTVSSRIGELVNRDIIMPFSERAMYALKLAASWTDAGKVLQEVTTHATEMISESKKVSKNGLKRKGTKNGTNPLRSRDVLKKIRTHPELSAKCISQLIETKRHPWDSIPRLLIESEWNAVVRLIATAKYVIGELESCILRRREPSSNTASIDTTAIPITPVEINEGRTSGNLRAMLNERGLSPRLHSAIADAIQKTGKGCKILRDEVIARGVALLQNEVALYCFAGVVKALLSDSQPLSDYELSNGSVSRTQEEELAIGKARPNGLTKPSAIFKVSQIQVYDVDNEDGYGPEMHEYDEFGDRINKTSGVIGDSEECPKSILLAERSDASRDRTSKNVSTKRTEPLVTNSDRQIVESARKCGEQLKNRDFCVQHNLTEKERDFILSQADAGIGLGIRYCGTIRKKGDREVAIRARLFLDSLATVAADTMGWPSVDSDYSVAQGASRSASECRSLLYSAGLM